MPQERSATPAAPATPASPATPATPASPATPGERIRQHVDHYLEVTKQQETWWTGIGFLAKTATHSETFAQRAFNIEHDLAIELSGMLLLS